MPGSRPDRSKRRYTMKITTANGKKKIVMTRKEWEAIGKQAGWNDMGGGDAEPLGFDRDPEPSADPDSKLRGELKIKEGLKYDVCVDCDELVEEEDRTWLGEDASGRGRTRVDEVCPKCGKRRSYIVKE
jgi:hypothetical protein